LGARQSPSFESHTFFDRYAFSHKCILFAESCYWGWLETNIKSFVNGLPCWKSENWQWI
jgi:hypothetical protein